MKTNLKIYLLLLALLSLPDFGHAQGTAFTYNGRLNNNGVPVNGPHEMRFTLYDLNVGGNVVNAPLNVSPVDVANGLFTVRLDFGAAVFTGPARWLDIAVRPVGAAAFTALSPRQEVTSSPYAIRAQTAGAVANSSVAANQLNTGGVAPTPGQFLSYNASGSLFWSAPGVLAGNIWSRDGTSAYYNAGNVGIGTLAPASKLEIRGTVGAIRLNPDLITIGSNNDGYELSLVGGVPDGSRAGGQIRLGGSGRNDGDLNVIQFKQNDSEVMRINNAGNVGIGTTTPGRLLQLGNSDTRSQGMLRLSSRSGTTTYRRNWDIGVPMSDNTLDGSFYSFVIDDLELGTGPEFMVKWGSGDVGIGTVTPRAKLHVNGGIWYDGVLNKLDVGESLYATVRAHDFLLGHSSRRPTPGRALVDLGDRLVVNFGDDWGSTVIGGAVTEVKTLRITGGADVAEPFAMPQEIAKGSVVVIDDAHPGQLKLSTEAYDKRVAGIVSGANGINPGIALHQEGALEGGQNVALSGRVYVQADAAFGAIQPGDLLTTSDTPGHAMKVTEQGKAQGAILGKAMSGLKAGTGMVLVLVTLQ